MKIINLRFLSLLASLSFLVSCATLEQDIPTVINTQERIYTAPEVFPSDATQEFPDYCELTGELQKVEGSEGCNIIIKLDDERILVPYESNRLPGEIKPNRRVRFGYEEVRDADFECQIGKLVRITCFRYVETLELEPPKRSEMQRRFYFER